MRASSRAALSRRRLANPDEWGRPIRLNRRAATGSSNSGGTSIAGWYPAVTNLNAAGGLTTFVLVQGASGWFYNGANPPRMVSIVATQQGGTTGTLVRIGAGALATYATPTYYPANWPTTSFGSLPEALAPFSQGGSVVAPRGGATISGSTISQQSVRASRNPALVGQVKPQGWGVGDEYWEYCVTPDWIDYLPFPNGYTQWGVCADVQNTVEWNFGGQYSVPIKVRRNGLKNGQWYTCTWERENLGPLEPVPEDWNWELVSCHAVTSVGGGGMSKQHPGGGLYQEPKDEPSIPRGGLAAAIRAANPEPPTVDWIPVEWIPATFFDAPPYANARRWVKLVRKLPAPFWPPGGSVPIPIPQVEGEGGWGAMYEGILFKNWGASQDNVVVNTRTIPLPGGGSRIEASIGHAFPGVPPGPGLPPGSGGPLRDDPNALPQGWMPATFFDTPPFPTARRWIKFDHPVPGLPASNIFYYAHWITQGGAKSEKVQVQRKTNEPANTPKAWLIARGWGWNAPTVGRPTAGARATNPRQGQYNYRVWPGSGGNSGAPYGCYPPQEPIETRPECWPWLATRYPANWPTTQFGSLPEALAPFSQGGSVVASSGGATIGTSTAPGTIGTSTAPGTIGTSTANPCRVMNPDEALLDMAALELRAPDESPLNGVAVLDVEPLDDTTDLATEGDVMVVSFVDPTDGREKIAAVMVMDAEDAAPWWKHDGHCCEECALGKKNPCGDSCGVADSAAVSNPAPRYGVFAKRQPSDLGLAVERPVTMYMQSSNGSKQPIDPRSSQGIRLAAEVGRRRAQTHCGPISGHGQTYNVCGLCLPMPTPDDAGAQGCAVWTP